MQLNEPNRPFRVALINPYELGRQSFAIAEPAAWLRRAGFEVCTLDLSRERLDMERLAGCGLVAIHLGMHTATRIATEVLPRVRAQLPDAHLCAFGLYAPNNTTLLREHGVRSQFGGECEPQLVALAEALRAGEKPDLAAEVSLARIDFITPDRSDMLPLSSYAKLQLPDGSERVTGFADASRGCKHTCRHCPVVPVYQGHFRIVPVDVVMADVRQQVAAGAQHISFGDPDFFNGSSHAVRVTEALHAEFPELTYDCTIKVEHLVRRPELIETLATTGCLWVTTAVESLDEAVLDKLDKGHTREEFLFALERLRAHGIAMAPTFIPFTPWTTLESYLELLETLVEQGLVNSVPPVQLMIRLLVPGASAMLGIDGFEALLEPFDPKTLGYPWHHADPRVDALQQEICDLIGKAEANEESREAIFARLWVAAHAALERSAPSLAGRALGDPIPALDEPWYCCAEPTEQQYDCV